MKHVRRYIAKLRQEDQVLQRHVAELDNVWDRRSVTLLSDWLRRSFEDLRKAPRPD